jgi:hypothetical protein
MTSMPEKGQSPYPDMPGIHITGIDINGCPIARGK